MDKYKWIFIEKSISQNMLKFMTIAEMSGERTRKMCKSELAFEYNKSDCYALQVPIKNSKTLYKS